ncbi:MAG TPA: hypothetical protein DDW98_07645 [Gammaproteobacteria bacterium]|nr:hypothetical protein [Gammaproteobacteria bacterium]
MLEIPLVQISWVRNMQNMADTGTARLSQDLYVRIDRDADVHDTALAEGDTQKSTSKATDSYGGGI